MSLAHKNRVLVVEDERNLRVSIEDLLEHEGFEVTLASTGEQALARLARESTDIIILDLSMPGIGGRGFLNQIARKGGGLLYPVVVLTARSQPESLLAGIPVDAILRKPCPEDELVTTLRSVLLKHDRSPASGQDAKPLVIVVEDDGEVAESIRRAFAGSGCQVSVVATGTQLLTSALSERPTAILLKCAMKEVSGLQLATLVESMPALSGIPVILHGMSETSSDLPTCVKACIADSTPSSLVQAWRGIQVGTPH